ncbi:hypothetical protein ACF0H5_015242 [Mactra antiquata]
MENKILLNSLVVLISMVIITVSSNPVSESVTDQSETEEIVGLEDFEVHPTNVKCVLIGPKDSEEGLLRKKRSGQNSQFKFGILGLANVDLITSVLDDKSRGYKPESIRRPTPNRRLLELMIRNGR